MCTNEMQSMLLLGEDSDLHLNSVMEKSFQNCMELVT